MAYIVRDNEIVPIAIPQGKRVKIGSNYRAPLANHIANDQLWIQDVFTFSNIPYYAVRFRFERYLVQTSLWLGVVVMFGMIGRYLLNAPA